MRGPTRHPLAWPALSGVLLAVAYYLPLLAPNLVAFVPLLAWLDDRPEASAWERLRAGFAFGIVCHLLTLHWTLALLRFSWLAWVFYLGLAFVFAAKISLIVALLGRFRRTTGLSWGLLLPACWLPFEWLQSLGDLRMTYDQVAYSMTNYPFLIQFADVTGVYGVGAALLAVNGLIHDAALAGDRAARRRAGLALAALATAVLAYDAVAWLRPLPDGGSMRVAVVQPDIPLLMKHDEARAREQDERLAALTRRAAADAPRLIVWPETARPDTVWHWIDRPQTYVMPEVQHLARETGAYLLVGADYVRVRDREDFDLYNAALLARPDGTLDPRWTAKVYLVPFVEAVPYRRWLGPLVEGRGGEWEWISGGFEAGEPGTPLDVDGVGVGVMVCFEQLFPDLSRELQRAGARLQVVVTNDAWFGRTMFQRYSADALRMRAIETRTPFVRAANTGISEFVDRRGRVHDATPLYEEAVISREVALGAGPTIATRVGDAPAWIVALLLVAIAVADRFRAG